MKQEYLICIGHIVAWIGSIVVITALVCGAIVLGAWLLDQAIKASLVYRAVINFVIYRDAFRKWYLADVRRQRAENKAERDKSPGGHRYWKPKYWRRR